MFVGNSNGNVQLDTPDLICLDTKILVSSAFIQQICIEYPLCAKHYFSHIELEIESVRFNLQVHKTRRLETKPYRIPTFHERAEENNFQCRPRRKIQRSRDRPKEEKNGS